MAWITNSKDVCWSVSICPGSAIQHHRYGTDLRYDHGHPYSPSAKEQAFTDPVCDADLDYLGRTDFKRIGDLLFAEMRTFGVLATELEWNQLQVRFLERHSYFTVTNKRLREPLKQQYLAELKQWLSDTMK